MPAAVVSTFTRSAFQPAYVPLGTVTTEYVIDFASGSFGTVNFERSRSISARYTRPVNVPGSMSNEWKDVIACVRNATGERTSKSPVTTKLFNFFAASFSWLRSIRTRSVAPAAPSVRLLTTVTP